MLRVRERVGSKIPSSESKMRKCPSGLRSSVYSEFCICYFESILSRPLTSRAMRPSPTTMRLMMSTNAEAPAVMDGSSRSLVRPDRTAVPVSVIVPVRNEGENLRRCLPALSWADEVFVVDSRSTDDTAEVAAEYGATLVQFRFNGSYPKKKNWALDNLPFRNEWVLIVDADEVVVPELAEEIRRRTEADEADGFYLNMKYYFLGRRIRHCGYAEAWNLRLFKHRLGR